MKRDEIKEGVLVTDKMFGLGKIKDVKKTVFTVEYSKPHGDVKYDYPHARFLHVFDRERWRIPRNLKRHFPGRDYFHDEMEYHVWVEDDELA